MDRLTDKLDALASEQAEIKLLLAEIAMQLRSAATAKADARSSVDLTLAMSQDDPLAALQERNKRLKQKPIKRLRQ